VHVSRSLDPGPPAEIGSKGGSHERRFGRGRGELFGDDRHFDAGRTSIGVTQFEQAGIGEITSGFDGLLALATERMA